MADTRLQDLIETLKKQGVESGEEASRRIVAEARTQADAILVQTREEADSITRKAQAEADKRMEQLKSSMEIAASQFVTSLKRVIEENLLALPLKKALDAALVDTDFLKSLLETLVLEYARHTGQKDLEILLPKDQQEGLADFCMGLIEKCARQVDGERLGLTLRSGDVEFGFLVGRAKGNVRLDFTAEAFQTLFLRFLAPRFRSFFKEIKLAEAAGR